MFRKISGMAIIALLALLLTAQPLFAATAGNGKTSGATGGSWLRVRAVTSASVPQGSKPDIVTSINEAKPNSFLANTMTKSEKKSVFTSLVDRIKSGMAYAWEFVRDWITGLFN
ncbi:hypothetical protein Tfer_2777 [Thermincola ferriacetica]|uniref:Uncharacterized protein n=1 Tax=Thermincola ferriacetica TaxID=281456 RepID=A0A0L6VZV9_9FIRM|nr:hypothetical protein [Thermincola ferriacetica]KNZ68683.1 hypothetical protein Tfer_2777 [Thermincola ferriacetica]